MASIALCLLFVMAIALALLAVASAIIAVIAIWALYKATIAGLELLVNGRVLVRYRKALYPWTWRILPLR
jgi:hypothetical protein